MNNNVIKVKPKQIKSKMTEGELLTYYETVKRSGKVSRVEKKYYRPRDKRVKEFE